MTQRKTSGIMEEITTLIMSAQMKPVESLLHDNKDDNGDIMMIKYSVP